MKTLALLARVFTHCFLVFGYPGETLALVVHILLYIPHTVICIAIQQGVLKCLNEVYSVAAPRGVGGKGGANAPPPNYSPPPILPPPLKKELSVTKA